jgi:hypothetical protein
MTMQNRTVLTCLTLILLSGCASSPAGEQSTTDGGAGASLATAGDEAEPMPGKCVVVDDGHGFPPATLSATPESVHAEWTSSGFHVFGTVDEKEPIVVRMRFRTCADVTAFEGIGFRVSSWSNIKFGLDSPSNTRVPDGTCVGAYCLPAHTTEYFEGGSQDFFSWSDFENGSPSAHGDPEHVLGLSWTLEGEPGVPVDTVIDYIEAYTPDL